MHRSSKTILQTRVHAPDILKFSMTVSLCLIAVYLLSVTHNSRGARTPTWESLDARPLPDWYDDAKVGIFIHWGVYSVPSISHRVDGTLSEWFWWDWKRNSPNPALMSAHYKPGFTYQEFAPMFTAELFDPLQWVELFQASGARYVVLTSKHHDGYALWPSRFSPNWNSLDVGPHRDLVGELANATREKAPDIHFGLYYSLLEWFNPLYLSDKQDGSQRYVENKMIPELKELVTRYRPEVVWADGDWTAPDRYWNSTAFLAWLYNDSPVKDTVVTNDRWGRNTREAHGGFWTVRDRYNPKRLMEHKFENCLTLDRRSWGYRRNAHLSDYLTIEQLLTLVVQTVSCNGNVLINVGPTKDGTIGPLFEERLRQLGSWLKLNGEAVYGSIPWKVQNDHLSDSVWYTTSKDRHSVYAFALKWPRRNTLVLGSVRLAVGARVSMLGHKGALTFGKSDGKTVIYFPALSINELPSLWCWVLKMEGAF
ncbi:alpha-L-fucosidase-like [Ornithodoros turicata]|uniref:alpha-L-fucosidase-like n=1 Tax=Ornithodoros turicata TaxID=34597 RepID=UPI0031393A95